VLRVALKDWLNHKFGVLLQGIPMMQEMYLVILNNPGNLDQGLLNYKFLCTCKHDLNCTNMDNDCDLKSMQENENL
jgi:hypothetical protein